ncbi:uncharacterized protein MONBRDRAFT_36667 [Monosiga brevicollis MX1]|uniref:SET domain-containing protein n=1 Tax=Monosiga brevicollis TaxID=81824 RepID=A9UWR1_MONBE|nr:uncharacterized protein MONBRDRAFT_36667 [Monosiga brevicollis MX1]EDQ90258.1 predicted protein [Monosiga brevicollis MX1]|eukprot:XP_001745025.1 hypothetical protein [Monosiga brevicollis MX1]
MGLFARRDIPAGTLILREPSAGCLARPTGYYDDKVPICANADVAIRLLQAAPELADQAWRQLQPRQHEFNASDPIRTLHQADLELSLRYMRAKLKAQPPVQSSGELQRLVAICMYNCFLTDHERQPGFDVLGLWPQAAAINHSCRPNATHYLDASAPMKPRESGADLPPEGGTMIIRSVSDIARGEPITISYVELGDPWPVRQEALRTGYGFACTCIRCTEEAALDSEQSLPGSKPKLEVAAHANGVSLEQLGRALEAPAELQVRLLSALHAKAAEGPASPGAQCVRYQLALRLGQILARGTPSERATAVQLLSQAWDLGATFMPPGWPAQSTVARYLVRLTTELGSTAAHHAWVTRFESSRALCRGGRCTRCEAYGLCPGPANALCLACQPTPIQTHD